MRNLETRPYCIHNDNHGCIGVDLDLDLVHARYLNKFCSLVHLVFEADQ